MILSRLCLNLQHCPGMARKNQKNNELYGENYLQTQFLSSTSKVARYLRSLKNARIWLLIQFRGLKNLAQQKDSNRAIKKEPKLKQTQTPNRKLTFITKIGVKRQHL